MSGWLVTGGCGFVGSNLADALLGAGVEVTVLDDLSRVGSTDNLAWLRRRHGAGLRFVRADVRDAAAVARTVHEAAPEAVAHLAGQVAMTTSIADPRRDFEVNALGTLNVLEAVRLHAPESAVLYSSTNKVYGTLEALRVDELPTRYALPDHPNGLDETVPLNAHSPYGCSKLSADQYVLDHHAVYGLRTVVFRHSSMYGGRQFATYDQGWIGWFCQQALAQAAGDTTPFTISGDGKQVRDLLHADDLVACYLAAAARIDEIAGRPYNIGGGAGSSLSLLELFSLLESEIGTGPLAFERLPWRSGDQRVFVADTAAAERDFGWRPTVDKHTGVRRMVAWCRTLADERKAA